MRLIKDKETKKLIDISEFDYLKALRNSKNPKELADYSDLPEVKEFKQAKYFRYFENMPWGIGILPSLSNKDRFTLIKIAKELSHQNNSDDNSFVTFARQKLVAHILELAYNLGLLNSYTISARKGKENGTSKKNEQTNGNKTNSPKQSRSRKKARGTEGDTGTRTAKVDRHSEASSRASSKSTEADSPAEAVSATEKSTS
jgi:hypothetical protein